MRIRGERVERRFHGPHADNFLKQGEQTPKKPLIKFECDAGIPSGAKARLHFVTLTARLNRLRKNPKGMAKPERNLPSGAKALFIPLVLSARLKPCPFKTTAETSFSATCEVVTFQSIDLFRGSLKQSIGSWLRGEVSVKQRLDLRQNRNFRFTVAGVCGL